MDDGFEAIATIDRPGPEVWRHLVDWAHWPDWMQGIDACRGPQQPAPGAELTFTARGAERQSTIREWVAGKRLVLESTQGPVTAIYTYECSPDGAGTRLRLRAHCRARGPMRLLMPIVRFAMKRVDGGQPAALKARVEGVAPSAPPAATPG